MHPHGVHPPRPAQPHLRALTAHAHRPQELFVRLEEWLEKSPQAAVLDDLFGGALCQQVLWRDAEGKQCLSERKEAFRVLQVA